MNSRAFNHSAFSLFTRIMFLLGAASAANGETVWTTADGNWSVPGNWSAGIPDATVDATFVSPTTYTVALTADAFAHDLNLTTGSPGNTLTFDTSGHTLKTGNLTFGYGTTAGVRLAGGGILSIGNVTGGRAYDFIGYGTGGNAALTVSGAGSQFRSSSRRNCVIGSSRSTGSLRLENGGHADVTGLIELG